MVFRNPFYAAYSFNLRLPAREVDSVRRTLQHCHDDDSSRSHYTSDVQILIRNPPLSSKKRNFGHFHRIKHSFSNVDFKAIYDKNPRSSCASTTDTPVLTRLSISQKKLNRGQYAEIVIEEVGDTFFPGQKPVPSTIEELAAPTQFCRKDEGKEKRQRTTKALSYLRTLGKSLKACYKKCPQPESPSARSLDIRSSFESSENEAREREVKAARCSGYMTERGDRAKALQNDIIYKGKDSVIDNLAEISKVSNLCKSQKRIQNSHSRRCNAEVKNGVKRPKKRYYTTTSISSGLSFAKKMELLAIGPILN